MAPLRERGNLFTGDLHVASRPLVPENWKLPDKHPSSTHFYVNRKTGKTSFSPEGDDWEYSKSLKFWHRRQALRIWACVRLIQKFGRYEASKRIHKLQKELAKDLGRANSYLDLLLSITYAAHYLHLRAAQREKWCAEARARAADDASWWRDAARRLIRCGPSASELAGTLAPTLEQVAEAPTLNGRSHPIAAVAPWLQVEPVPERPVWEWIDYQLLSRNLKDPDVAWLLAHAIMKYRDSRERASLKLASRRVSEYLDLLDAPFGNPDVPDQERGPELAT
ncbi:MAG: hypothetical protein ACE5MH_07735 [Terriglobia bacterium]